MIPEPGRYGPPPVPAIDPSPMPAPFPGPAPVPVPVPVPPPVPGPLLAPAVGAWTGTPARSVASAGALTTGRDHGRRRRRGGRRRRRRRRRWFGLGNRRRGWRRFHPLDRLALRHFRDGHGARELASALQFRARRRIGLAKATAAASAAGAGRRHEHEADEIDGFRSTGSVTDRHRPEEHDHGEQARVSGPRRQGGHAGAASASRALGANSRLSWWRPAARAFRSVIASMA